MYLQSISITQLDIPPTDNNPSQRFPIIKKALTYRADLPDIVEVDNRTYIRQDILARKYGYTCTTSIGNTARRYGMPTKLVKKTIYVDDEAFSAWLKDKPKRFKREHIRTERVNEATKALLYRS